MWQTCLRNRGVYMSDKIEFSALLHLLRGPPHLSVWPSAERCAVLPDWVQYPGYSGNTGCGTLQPSVARLTGKSGPIWQQWRCANLQ